MDATEALVTQYEMYLRSWQASETTIKARLVFARSRLKSWGVDGFTRARITQFLAVGMDGQPRKKWTTATYHNHLKDLCAFLVAAGLIEESPMPDIKRAARPGKRPRPINEEELERVIHLAEGQVCDWIILASYAGLRSFEVAKVRGEDFTDEGLYVYGKGGKEATLPIHPLIAEMRERYPARGFWFPGNVDGHVSPKRVTETVSVLFTAVGIDGSIHRCRHSYATRLLRAGVNIRVVQRLMRHSSLETTAGYLAVLGDEEREAILRLDNIA